MTNYYMAYRNARAVERVSLQRAKAHAKPLDRYITGKPLRAVWSPIGPAASQRACRVFFEGPRRQWEADLSLPWYDLAGY